MKKQKRLLIKAIHQYVETVDGLEFLEYEDGIRKHDVIYLSYKGKDFTVSVSCTSGRGPEAGAKRAIRNIKSIVERVVKQG